MGPTVVPDYAARFARTFRAPARAVVAVAPESQDGRDAHCDESGRRRRGEPAAGGDANAAPADDNAGGNDQDAEAAANKQSMLGWVYDALGPGYMIVFLAISFTLVALFVMNIITNDRSKVCPVELVDDFEEMLNNKQYQDAYEMAKEHEYWVLFYRLD